MSLNIGINKLAEMKALDEEGFIHYQEVFQQLNHLLQANHLQTYQEPIADIAEASRAPLKSFPSSWLHFLRWVEIQVSENPHISLRPVMDDAALQAKLQKVDFIDFMDDPLINHADNDGYYLPVAFDEVLFDKATEQCVGSSHQLMAVLLDIAPYLHINLRDNTLTAQEIHRLSQIIADKQDFYREIAVWLALFEASRLSIYYQTAIVFS